MMLSRVLMLQSRRAAGLGLSRQLLPALSASASASAGSTARSTATHPQHHRSLSSSGAGGGNSGGKGGGWKGVESSMSRLGGSWKEPGEKMAWQADEDSDIQRVTTLATIHELTKQQTRSIETVVPWFLKNMPASYFRQVPESFRQDHLRAISAIKDANMDSTYYLIVDWKLAVAVIAVVVVCCLNLSWLPMLTHFLLSFCFISSSTLQCT
jgi:hypothetical protein